MALRCLGKFPFAASVLGVASVLASSSIGSERSLDDFVLGLVVSGRGAAIGLQRRALDAFAFTTGSRAENQRLMDQGVMLPWWSDPNLRLGFLRPLPAFSHWLDESLSMNDARFAHWHSLLWFTLLLGTVLCVYRRFESSSRLAGLSLALYALDDAHGATLGWIANRNALQAATFSGLTLILHDRFRNNRRVTAGVLALAAFSCGLACGELAVAGLGYLIAYALFLDSSSCRERIATLIPYLAVCLAWRVLAYRLGYGASGSGAYVDPFSDGVRFMSEAPFRWLSLLQGQWGIIPADLGFLGPRALQPLLLLSGVFTVLFAAWLLAPHWGSARSRFWLVGMLLSLLPLAATFPNDRMLLFVGLGAAPLLSRALLALAVGRWRVRAGSSAALHVRRCGLALAALIHLIWAPLLLPLRAAQMNLLARVQTRAWLAAFSDPELLRKDWVVLSAPNLLLVNYVLAERRSLNLPAPDHLHLLATGESAVRVERSSSNSLTLTPDAGFLTTPLERNYRARSQDLGLGVSARLASFSAQVRRVDAAGNPRSVRFTFGEPLERIAFWCWRGDAFEACSVPEQGEARVEPAASLGPVLLRAALAGEWK